MGTHAMARRHTPPTEMQLRLAYAMQRGMHWPPSYESAMAHPLYGRLVQCRARGLALAEARQDDATSSPPAERTFQPSRFRSAAWTFDAKRAAANDRDDD